MEVIVKQRVRVFWINKFNEINELLVKRKKRTPVNKEFALIT
jgi:hypothetical protein